MAGGADDGWIGTWATAPTAVPASGVTVLQDQTVRQVAHASLGGSAVRIRLTNEFGDRPLSIGEARVALLAAGGPGTDIDPRTDRRLTFGGQPSALVPAGAPLLSDPAPWALPPGADLVVSIHLPERTPITTVHGFSVRDNVVAAGNVTAARAVAPTATVTQWYLMSGISVRAGVGRPRRAQPRYLR